ncbi:MAG: TolC family protein [Bacteroidia bacterium]|nr:TolC family protein [Bacteroidia bacterium]
MNRSISLHFLSLFILLIFSQNLFSQESAVKKFTLKQAQDYALQNNPNINNARLDRSIAKKTIWETTAIGLPQLNVKGSYSNIFKVPTVAFPSTTLNVTGTDVPLTTSNFNDYVHVGYGAGEEYPLSVKENTTFDFTLSQLIFSGAYIVGLKASRTFFEISQQSLEKSESELRESVSNSYYMVLIIEENKRILSSILENITRLAYESKETAKQGFIEETDADQLQLTKTNVENSLNTLTSATEVAYNVLKMNLGLDNTEKVELTEKIDDIVSNIDLALLTHNFDVTHSINFRILSNSEQLSRLNLKKDESAYLPTVSAFFNHQKQLKSPEFNFMSPNTLGVTLTMPIFTSGQRMATVSKRKMEVEKAVNSKDQVARSLEIEAQQAKSDFSSKLAIYQNDKKNLELAGKIYNSFLTKYKEGVSSSMELAQAQSQYLTTQSDYFNAVSALLTVRNKLVRVME